ncbi:glucose dehydrogenase [FAD, quinone]-like isoform X3 [Daphnia pulex]|uniref:glucose dehydrogenase [FAD, quinone]-like isoform X3 n=1 Tax=Daphnia pulex TaxID=6669 RepID=UPI001EDEB4FC|nr:glucose dehydrogenase [FAD, quinone]-like isoform X3 [Daphnia pulex]
MLLELSMTLTTLLGKYFFLRDSSNNPEGVIRDSRGLRTEYDFIIIGAGSAGAVIANRLTEIEEWKVLLLEAGGDENLWGQVPAAAADIQLTERDWQYQTEEMRGQACLGLENQRCLWPRGKMMGGTSSINYMLYVRGNRRDYDQWAQLGNYGWSYDDVLPYFVKSEDNQNPYLAGTKYHGKGGYLTVSEAGYQSPLGGAFIQGGKEMGYENRDGNGEYQTGFMFAQGTIRKGHRCSSSKAFIRPIRKRKNLHISMHSHVTKILIDPKTKQAYGVQFQKRDRIYHIFARKEVILSAGDTASPHLLMLSGIGPAPHLQEKGIYPIHANLPVGKNLHDHVALGEVIFLIDQPYSLKEERVRNVQTILNYTAWGGTPLSMLGGVEGLAWLKTKYADANDDWPDVQFHFIGSCVTADRGRSVRYSHGVSDSVWEEYYLPIIDRDCWSVMPVTLRPRSRGYIRLNSADPFDKPIINPNYYSDPYDLAVTIEGIKLALQLSQTSAFKKMNSKFYDKPFPGCEGYPMGTDDYWACWVRSYSVTLAHTAGTCQMGPDNDPMAVVDPLLRVRGIRNLRVADTSIMPLVPSGNTNAAAIMIGEKASDLIKDTWYTK